MAGVRVAHAFFRTFCSAAVKLECEILEMDGEAEYVHLLVAYSSKLAAAPE
ncbi:transposase IS200 like family protein [Escherichia coli TW15901]|nr:transposase IS200 like family protein [Escherichia coli TW15901]